MIRGRIVFAALLLAVAGPLAAAIPSPVRFASGYSIHDARSDQALELDVQALAELKKAGKAQEVRVERFPFAPGAVGDLVLERFDVATPDAKVLVQTRRASVARAMPAVAHFSGRLEGDIDSRVYVGVQETFLIAVLQTSAGLVYVGPPDPGSVTGTHVLRRSDSLENLAFAPREWHCAQEDLPQALDGAPEGPAAEPSARTSAIAPLSATALKDATISIETDQELLARFGGDVSSMSSYVTTLLGAISAIYQRDVQVRLTVNLIQAWSTTDPYAATSPRSQLDEVGDWWHANRPKTSYPRTLVHYLSGKTVSGGIAWLGVLCNADFSNGGHWGGAYGVTQINGNYPSSLWDLIGVSHEIGHNFGSPHTHCYVPAIDQCYGAENGCYAGPTANPGPQGGTLMSYCHLLPGGYGNISLRFHERCISERMIPEVNSVTCLTTVAGDGLVPTAFYSVNPCRVVDTRGSTGPWGAPSLAANTSRTFTLAGRCGIPSGARAVSLNLTVTQPTGAGALRLYPGGTPVPLASAINYRASQTRANNAIIALGDTGGLAVRCDQSAGNVQVIIDVNGYFQ